MPDDCFGEYILDCAEMELSSAALCSVMSLRQSWLGPSAVDTWWISLVSMDHGAQIVVDGLCHCGPASSRIQTTRRCSM